ncbi:MAG TPA: lipopolysaccharide biosynthesis protein [Candidatus Didemnitutus sp.]|nr:lipopolysaccharide biosynthesis protein [Candidatus Didemnitutus sp.]
MKTSPSLGSRLRAGLKRPPHTFALFFATSLGARAIGIGCQLLQVALVVKTLGTESFGLWMTMTSVTSLVLFADLGLGIGAQNRVAEHLARGETTEARTLFATVFVMLAGIGVTLAIVLTPVVAHLDFAALFRLHTPSTVAQATGAALALCWVFCAGFPFALAQRLAFARQEGWTYNVAQAGGNVLSLALVAYGAHAGWGLGSLVASSQGALVVSNAVLLAVQLWQLRWLDPRRLGVRLSLLREMAQLGAFFSVQQILATVLFSLPQVIISATLGAAAVTPYNLVQRLFNLFAIVQNAFMLPLWPAYSQAKARQEFDWMRRTLRRSVHATALCCVAPMVASACVAPQIIHFWVGTGDAQPGALLIWLLCAWNALAFFQQPYTYLLVGVSEIRRTTLYSVLSALVSTALMYGLARPFGAPGVALGLILGYLPFNFIGNLVETRRYLRTAPTVTAAAAPVPAA